MGSFISTEQPPPTMLEYTPDCIPDLNEFQNLRIFQIMVSSFQASPDSKGYGIGYGPSHHKGNLRGIINALDYIKSLNVNAIWLTPIFDSSAWFWQETPLSSTGYFARDYFNVDPHFGTNQDFRELVREAHNRNLYVILDGVFGHHGSIKRSSPLGRRPHSINNVVSYPESLGYFKEVAAYWIKEYAIDGWRLDQSYQMYQHDHNFLREIRETIEITCAKRRQKGEKWGILGYVVGEHWSGPDDISTKTYGQNGLRSAFDFPARYDMVKGIAQEESGAGPYGAWSFSNMFRTLQNKGYPENVYPNMFLTNHDLWRFGNLLRSKYETGPDSEQYWSRYKIAHSAICAYSGPITLYYGDEYGALTPEWYSPEHHSCGPFTFTDNCSRTDGMISGFNENQQDLLNWVSNLMKIRQENPALWRGTNNFKVYNNEVLVNYKHDEKSNNNVIFICNLSTDTKTVKFSIPEEVKSFTILIGDCSYEKYDKEKEKLEKEQKAAEKREKDSQDKKDEESEAQKDEEDQDKKGEEEQDKKEEETQDKKEEEESEDEEGTEKYKFTINSLGCAYLKVD